MSTTEYKYHLQPYSTNAASRHECPQCHDAHSFTYYVDEEGRILDESVGRCNHENGCGYHYTPSMYFQDHPESRTDSRPHYRPSIRQVAPKKVVKTLCFIDKGEVTRCFDRGLTSDFAQWLLKHFDRYEVGRAFQRYMVGTLPDKRSVFWQVDKDWRVRTGKVIQYDPDNGHRLHGEDPRLIDKGVEVNWIHSRLKRSGILPEDWTLTQCLFGEHLLKDGMDERPIAVVEGEKTAVIASIRFPQFLWLSCGGLRNFTEDKMRVLTGRVVTLFPDADGFQAWEQVRLKLSKYAKVKTSTITNDGDPRHKKWDIADLIIDEIEHPDSIEAEHLRELVEEYPDLRHLIRLFDCEIITT